MKVFSFGKFLFWLLPFLMLVNINAAAVPSADFDGDGRTDVLAIRSLASEGYSYNWYILQSRDGFAAYDWGRSTSDYFDVPVPADYDGDGKTDVAVWRYEFQASSPTPAYWYVLRSRDNTFQAVQWGLNYDTPAAQDYDGDGTTDFAVYRGGTWFIRRSSDRQLYAEQFGLSNDKPLRGGDYDGDGKADLAVVRYGQHSAGAPVPTTLYIRRSDDGTWAAYDLGDARNTAVVTGDYDGDGKADVAVWRGGLWLWIKSSDNQVESARFGLPLGDAPAAGDYDGDGKTDPAVYRQEFQKYLYILQSRDGFKAIPWGLSNDGGNGGTDFIPAVGF